MDDPEFFAYICSGHITHLHTFVDHRWLAIGKFLSSYCMAVLDSKPHSIRTGLQQAQQSIQAEANSWRSLIQPLGHLRADRSQTVGDQMPGPADSGLFIYAKDTLRIAAFYESLLGMTRRHVTSDLVVLQGGGLQLVVHALPPEMAVAASDPPTPRDSAALKFFFTVPSLASAREIAPTLGGMVLSQEYSGRGFRASNAIDPEGNIFHLRESAP